MPCCSIAARESTGGDSESGWWRTPEAEPDHRWRVPDGTLRRRPSIPTSILIDRVHGVEVDGSPCRKEAGEERNQQEQARHRRVGQGISHPDPEQQARDDLRQGERSGQTEPDAEQPHEAGETLAPVQPLVDPVVPELRRVPVVIVSIVADRNKGFSLGAAAVMQKPMSRQELYDSLEDLGFPLSEGETLKVLVVDDDPKAVELVAVRLVGLATTVLRAHSGQEAIDLARLQLPDVIVLDLMMPEVSGFDVVEALNEHPATAQIPILVVTAKEITDEDRTKLHGCVEAVMEKADFNSERFATEVRRATSKHTHTVVA